MFNSNNWFLLNRLLIYAWKYFVSAFPSFADFTLDFRILRLYLTRICLQTLSFWIKQPFTTTKSNLLISSTILSILRSKIPNTYLFQTISFSLNWNNIYFKVSAFKPSTTKSSQFFYTKGKKCWLSNQPLLKLKGLGT